MKNIIKNKNGFTLVELLAVIVVLAIIILVAMPNVMSAMEKARRNTFYTEATEICKIAQNAYNTEILEGSIAGGTKACYTLEYLVNKGHMDKNTDGYKGAVEIDFTGDVAKTTIYLSNKSYKYEGVLCNNLSKKPGNGSNMQQSTSDVTIPTSCTNS